ncbi:MAG TPA: LptF/LptG family permease [Opitutales bacterium]|nr:LptF/LptG family permease [Opitutales bacterium]
MRLLDRYLLLEWLKALGLALGATLGVLLLMDLYSNVGDLMADGAHPRDLFYYYRELLPSFLPSVLPLSQLVTLLFVLGNLHRNNEITTMRAAGLSLWRISRPLWLGGAVLAGLLAWLDAGVVNDSIKNARDFRANLHAAALRRANPNATNDLVYDLTYDDAIAHRQWFINRYSQQKSAANGVSVYEMDAQGANRRYVLAKDGQFDAAAGGWVLEGVAEIVFEADGIGQSIHKFPQKTYPEFFADNPGLMLELRQQPDDLSADELDKVLQHAPAGGAMAAYWVERYEMLAKPLICLLVVALAVPFAVAGVRTGPLAGASKAIGLFFAYYVISGISTHLGDQHYLPALLAAGLPIIVMLAVSAWLFRKAA